MAKIHLAVGCLEDGLCLFTGVLFDVNMPSWPIGLDHPYVCFWQSEILVDPIMDLMHRYVWTMWVKDAYNRILSIIHRLHLYWFSLDINTEPSLHHYTFTCCWSVLQFSCVHNTTASFHCSK